MQIKCSKDIGAWWDELSIFNVKINTCIGTNKEKNILNFEKLAREIKEQIGIKLFDDIIGSDEYQKLYQANLDVFKKIEIAQKGEDKFGKETDDLNYARYLRKTELQRKYFGTEANEVKVGY